MQGNKDPQIIQFHILRSLPANLANSGEDGSPKKMSFGGTERFRLSSQSIKARMRASSYFRDGTLPMATRTTALPELVKIELQKMSTDQGTIDAIVTKMVNELGKEGGKNKKAKDESAEADEQEVAEHKAESTNSETQKPAFANTKASFLIAPNEPADIARHFLEQYAALGHAAFVAAPMGKLTANFRGDGPISVDAAMFGRFSTSGVLARMEAAAYVSHALSTHYSPTSNDFYASREESPFGDRETPMIGDSPFVSGIYYHHIALDLRTLLANLDGDVDLARRAVKAFVWALLSAETVPAGKQHGMFCQTLPDYVVVEAVTTSCTYAPAFGTPVRANRDMPLANASAQSLEDYIAMRDKKYSPIFDRKRFSMLPGLDDREMTVDQLAEWAASLVPESVAEAA